MRNFLGKLVVPQFTESQQKFIYNLMDNCLQNLHRCSIKHVSANCSMCGKKSNEFIECQQCNITDLTCRVCFFKLFHVKKEIENRRKINQEVTPGNHSLHSFDNSEETTRVTSNEEIQEPETKRQKTTY